MFALLARAVDSENYLSFNRGDITDADFSDSLFEKVGMRNLKKSPINATIDGLLCFAYLYKLNKEEKPEEFGLSLIHQRIESIRNSLNPNEHELSYANSVRENIQMFDQNTRQRFTTNIGRTYFGAVERIELLVTPSLDGE